MTGLLHQALLVAGLATLALAGPALAIQFLLRRKARDRARRKSPLSADLLRAPGETLSDQLVDTDGDILGWVAILMVLPLVLVCLHLGQSYLLGTPESAFRWIFLGVMIVSIIATGVRKLHALAERKDNLRLGLDGERAVGEELNQLMRKGAVVFHDVPCEEFNVDHVVVARQGVFAIETKGYAKPVGGDGKANARVVYDGSRLTFPMFKTAKPLEQAERQARWLGQWLTKAVGSPVAAMPVVALPGWFVDVQGKGTVRVYSGKQLYQLLDVRGALPVSEQDVERITYQLEQRCRTARRSFGPPDDKAT